MAFNGIQMVRMDVVEKCERDFCNGPKIRRALCMGHKHSQGRGYLTLFPMESHSLSARLLMVEKTLAIGL